MKEILTSFFLILIILVIILIAWGLFWKFILEPNPIIQDFFDLKKNIKNNENNKKK